MNRAEFLYKIGMLFIWAWEHNIKVICFTFYRSPEQQKIEYDAGRSKTLHSKHQEWLAMDLALWDDINEDKIVNKDEIRWKNDSRYKELGDIWESFGGRWQPIPGDIYHFEA